MRYECDTCGTIGTEDDLCEHGEPCPDEECEGTCHRIDPIEYEVTVPLVVQVRLEPDGTVTVEAVEVSNDWGGFFSEAEQSGGCWNHTEQEWEYDEAVCDAARDAARAALMVNGQTFGLIRPIEMKRGREVTNMTTFQEVLDFVSSATEQEVRLLFDAGKRRTKTIRENTAAANAATLKVGDRVRTKGLSPKYLSGLPATVTRVDRTKISVEVDEGEDTGRYGRFFTVPASALEAI